MTVTKKDLKSFEANYNLLTEMVSQLENDKLPLADALAKYEEAMKLAIKCRSVLEYAQQEVDKNLSLYNEHLGKDIGEE